MQIVNVEARAQSTPLASGCVCSVGVKGIKLVPGIVYGILKNQSQLTS